jgi:flagellar capping protein FliD
VFGQEDLEMGTTSAPIFNGTSSYSQDFQNVITRATGIASLPITLLNSDKSDLTDQATALTSLDGKIQAVQTAVQGISDALAGAAFEADVSDSGKLRVNLSDGALEGNYTVDVVNPGAYATSMTANAWVEGTGAVRSYSLSCNGRTYALTPADNSAAAVAAAVNSQYSAMVHATVVNVGSAAAPDYRISLQAARLGDTQPDLWTGPSTVTSLQTQQAHGSSTLAASQTGQSWNADPSLTFQLSLHGQVQGLSPADNTVQSVADAINSQFGSKVTASVVDVDPNGSHDYRISLVAKDAGDLQPDILASDGVNPAVSLQQQTATASDTLAVSTTTANWTVDTGAPLAYQLSIGGASYAFAPTDNSAASVVDAINQQYGNKVTAALNDTLVGGAHNYKITLTAVEPGDLAPDLTVGPTSLQKQQTTGALADYIVNNSGKDVTSDTRSVTIAKGVSVTLLAKDDGSPVNITVTRSTSALSSALSSLADAYNAAVDELDKQHTQTRGALSGQSIVSDLSRLLSGIATYNAGGAVSGLADLGLELDKTGHLNFNAYKLMAADISNSSAVTTFFGSSSSGFLKSALDGLNRIEDASTGLLPAAEGAVQARIASVTDTIADKQAQVDQLTENLQQQMAAADAAIASMQQQYSYLYSMFSAMQTAAKQYQ